ncbi:VWA domain-containing protein [Luteimonas vadosa]
MTLDAIPLSFLRPLWLFALLALPLVAGWWWRRRGRDEAWRAAVDAHLLPHLLDARGGARGQAGFWIGLLAFALAIVALAGPSWRSEPQPLQQGEAPLVIALDLSSATLAADLPPSRLLQARAKIATLLRQRTGGQVGLVAFADDAFTVAPLTSDAANVALFLDALAPDVMPVDGERADRAIAWSVELLRRAGFDRGDILLMTDDADARAQAAASRALAAGFRVSALGLGRTKGAAYRRADGGIAHARLDAGSLRALATAGGGRYGDWTADDGDLETVGLLAAQPAGAAVARGPVVMVPQDGGYWLLPPLMLLALFAFRRGGALAAVMLCLLLPWQPAHAQATEDGGWWRRPDQAAHARKAQAEAAYREGEFGEAARLWSRFRDADSAYNRGNALAKAGRYEHAIKAYDQALRQDPGMADAIANKQAVEAAMKRKPPPSPRDNSRGDQQQRPDQGQPQPNAGDPGGQGETGDDEASGEPRPEPQGDPKPDAGERDPATPPEPPPGDPDRQREADAAQRERMQRALEQGDAPADDGRQVEGEPDRAESAADRERAQANEAWLRRVPDDPGGLLRAKFRLEHERRQQSRGDAFDTPVPPT